METKNKGITLIALIITIIVLLILAGVTIATLTGSHGILTQVDNAKASTIKSKVEEEIDLAVQSANLKIRTRKAQDNSWNAVTEGILPTTAIEKTPTSDITNEETNGAVLVTLLADLQKEDYYVAVTSVEGEGTGATRQIIITYEGKDYQKAKKDPNAKITKTLDVSPNKIIYGDCNHNWNEEIITEASCTEAGSKKQTCIECGETRTVTIPAGHSYGSDNICTRCGDVKVVPKVGDYVNYTPTPGEYKVGVASTGYGAADSVQTISTQTGAQALKWRIWSISDDKIELVAETQTTDLIYLKGAPGYNHCVDILNDLCKDLYSNSSKGATARSITIEDILSKVEYEIKNYSEYGTTIKQMSTYESGFSNKYPNIYLQEDGHTSAGLTGEGLTGSKGLDNRAKTAEGVSTYADAVVDADNGVGSGIGTASTENDVYATYTYAYFKPEEYLKTDLGVNNAKTELITTGTTYWLASRCVGAYSNSAIFYLRYLRSDGNVDGGDLFYSSGGPSERGYAVRPIITLPSNIEFTKDNVNSTTETTYWNF